MTISEIAEQYGISTGTIATLFSRMGIKPIDRVKRKGVMVPVFSEYHVEKMVKRYREAVKKAEEKRYGE